MKGLLLKDWYMLKKYCRSYLFVLVIFLAVSIFDTDNSTVSDTTRRFLKNYEKDGRVISAGNEIPKSFVLYFEEKLNGTVDPKICFSQLSSASLSGRNEKK